MFREVSGQEFLQKYTTLVKEDREKFINSLSLADQIQLFLMMPWEKRIEIIISSQKIDTLVESLPTEELFWTIKSSSPEDIVILFPYLNPEQIQFIFDLEWWYKQDLKPESILSWLILMLEAEDDVFLKWLSWIHRNDDALIPLILRQFVKVQKRPDDMDPTEARDVLYGYTFDDTHFFEFKSDKIFPIFDRILKLIFDYSKEYFFSVMDYILIETNIEQLERAFRYRNIRLEDFGIPNYYDAIEILTPPPQNQVRKISEEIYGYTGLLEDYSLPFVPTIYKGDYPALNRAITPLFGTNYIERIISEWIGVCNKFIVATLNNFDEPKNIEKALKGVSALLNLGLSIQAEREKKDVVEVLKFSILEDLVRIAISRLIELRTKIRKLIQDNLIPEDLSYLIDDWQDVIKSLNKKVPLYYENGIEEYFSNQEQIVKVEEKLIEVEVMAKIMQEITPNWKEWKFVLNLNNTNILVHKELTWDIALLTTLANVSLFNIFKLSPIPESELDRIKLLWFPEGTKKVPDSTVEKLCDILDFIVEKHDLSSKVTEKIIRELLKKLQYEWERIGDESLDFTKTTLLWIDLI